LDEILNLGLESSSNEPYNGAVLIITKEKNIVSENVFDEIDFIECHEDGTIIFQAPNCDLETDFRDVVYCLAYAPKGIEHIKRKKKADDIKQLENHWYLFKDISSIAN